MLCADAERAAALRGLLGERSPQILVPVPVSRQGAPAALDAKLRLWRGVDPDASPRVAEVEIDAADQRAWPETLKSLSANFGAMESTAIFLRGSGVNPAVAREFRTIAELMGLA
jgi:hypothetical protein